MTSSRSFTPKVVDLKSDLQLNVLLSGPDPSSSPVPTVLFLHFWGGSSALWHTVATLLPPTYPAAALDFRGWGASTGPDDREAYSIGHLASDVEAVIIALKLESVVLVGLSMGAKVAQAVAGRGNVPGLQGMVLVGPAPPTPLVLLGEMREQQVHAYDNAQSAEFVARHVLTSPGAELGYEVYNSVVADMLRGNRWAREAWPAYAVGEDVVALAKRIRVPVLVVGGEMDVVEPVERLESDVVANIEGAKLVVLEGAGHLMPLEKPDELADVIRELVEQNMPGEP